MQKMRQYGKAKQKRKKVSTLLILQSTIFALYFPPTIITALTLEGTKCPSFLRCCGVDPVTHTLNAIMSYKVTLV